MLLEMINDILDLAKIESGKMEVRIEDFSIRDVCEALTQPGPAAGREEEHRPASAGSTRRSRSLRQDPGKLQQILYNLLSNAIKFTPEGGRVTAPGRGRRAVRGARGGGHGHRHRRGRPGDRSSRSSARPRCPARRTTC